MGLNAGELRSISLGMAIAGEKWEIYLVTTTLNPSEKPDFVSLRRKISMLISLESLRVISPAFSMI
jgi:hypothetical protein